MGVIKKQVNKVLVAGAVSLTTLASVMMPTGSVSAAQKKVHTAPVVITFGTWIPWSAHPGHVKLLNEINKANKGKFIIKPVYTPPTGYDQKLLTELAAGDAPDFFYLDYGYVQSFASNNTLLNLNPYLKQFQKTHPAARLSDYYPASLSGDKVNGKYYGLPFIDQPYVMYYNPKLFKAAHLPLPTANWTWSTFLKDARALSKPAKGQYGYLQANGWPPLETYIWSFGGHMFNPAGTRAELTSPADMKGIELMQTMVKDKIVPPQAAIENLNIEDLFRQGKVAMFLGGANDGNYTYANHPIDTAIAPIPRGTKQVTGSYVAEIAVNAKAANPKIVVEAYLDLLAAYAHTHVVPPLKSFAKNLKNIAVTSAPGGRIPAARIPVILDSMKFARPLRPMQNMTQYYNIMTNDLYDPILLGTSTAKAAALKAETDMNNYLKNPNG